MATCSGILSERAVGWSLRILKIPCTRCMSIVNCVNNWCLSCVLITISLGDNHLSICDLLIKKSFIMSRKRVKNEYRSVLHVMTRPKLWWSSNLVIIYKLQSVWAYYLGYHLQVRFVLLRFFAVRLSRLVLTLCNLEQYEVDIISSDMVKKKQIMFPISFITHCVI